MYFNRNNDLKNDQKIVLIISVTLLVVALLHNGLTDLNDIFFIFDRYDCMRIERK